MVAILSHLIEEFPIHLNSIDDWIQFTVEHQQDRCIPMLDTKISILDDGSLKFEVYRKKTHTDQYLQYDSHQPLQHKLGVVRTVTQRATTITTKPEDLAREMSHLHEVLHNSGYPSWVTKAPNTTKVTPHPGTNKTHVAGHVTLPYIEGVTEAISRKLHQQGVVTHAVPFDTIRKRLKSPKDKNSISNMCGVVYQLECSEWGENYIGETERPLKKRLNEHHRDSSPVGHHLSYSGHHLTGTAPGSKVALRRPSTSAAAAPPWTVTKADTTSPTSTTHCCHVTLRVTPVAPGYVTTNPPVSDQALWMQHKSSTFNFSSRE